MNLSGTGTQVALGAAALAGLYWLVFVREGEGGRNPVGNAVDTFFRGTEMFFGGDGLSEVAGTPTTAGSYLFDTRQALLDGVNDPDNIFHDTAVGTVRLIDPVNNVSGAPQTLGGAIFDARTAIGEWFNDDGQRQ